MTISFHQFMSDALYHPKTGYYMREVPKLGAKGDFTTAAESTPLLALTFARVFKPILMTLQNPIIVEMGAGSGRFAVSLLNVLSKIEKHESISLIERYYICEISEYHQAQQRTLFLDEIPEWMDRIVWTSLSELKAQKQQLQGIVFANEVLDALPVHRFGYEHGVFFEWGVSLEGHWIKLPEAKMDLHLKHHLLKLKTSGVLQEDANINSEVNLEIKTLMYEVDAILEKGVSFWVDYGYSRMEYYAPYRSEGTLMGYYQHKIVENVLSNPGKQDITAHVDFTYVAETFEALDWVMDGYLPQGLFLQQAGILEIYHAQAAQLTSALDKANLLGMLKKLSYASEYADIFKVFVASKAFSEVLDVFEHGDGLHRL